MLGHRWGTQLADPLRPYLYAKGQLYEPLPFLTPGLTGLVRRPLLVGFVIAIWATPTMTQGHLLFAAVTTAYIIVAVRLEERDLLAYHGDQYAAIRVRCGCCPRWPRLRHEPKQG